MYAHTYIDALMSIQRYKEQIEKLKRMLTESNSDGSFITTGKDERPVIKKTK